MQQLLIFAILVTLSGCFQKKWSLQDNTPWPEYPTSLTEEREKVLKSGASEAYADGYIDGCSTGRRTLGNKKFSATKNKKRCKKEPDYKMGWDEGYDDCQQEGYEILKVTSEMRKKHEDPMISNWEELRK